MKNIKSDIEKNEYKSVYLLCGEEAYLRNKYKNMLKAGICGDDTMNLSIYQGEGIDVNAVADDCKAMPFFAQRRLIIIENSGMLKSSSEQMAGIIRDLPETTCVVFVESETDKRNKLYKTIKEKGYICEMNSQKPETLYIWLAQLLKEADKKISKEDAQFLIMRTGTDMYNLSNEIQKLISYSSDSQIITREAIELMCSVHLEDKIFEMINAITKKDSAEAMRLYADLLVLKVAPLKILAILSKKYGQLLTVKDMLVSGHNSKDIASRVGIAPYFVNQYIAQAKLFAEDELKDIICDCVDTEASIKSGRTEDKYAVELLIIKYSRK